MRSLPLMCRLLGHRWASALPSPEAIGEAEWAFLTELFGWPEHCSRCHSNRPVSGWRQRLRAFLLWLVEE